MSKKLLKYKNDLHHHLIHLVKEAITSWRTTAAPPRPAFLHPAFHDLFQKQSEIGWDHVIQGRFSTAWTSIPDHPISETCLVYIIRSTWNALHDVCVHRCNRNHGTSTDTARHRLTATIHPQVEKLYRIKVPYP
jgi:hypothetical protein